jgi:threonine dehydratase
MTITAERIREAAQTLRDNVVDTPCPYSRTLSAITGAEIVLKLENLQFTASFKERGALLKLLSLSPEERAGGVVTASAGNHGLAVAYHAQRLGIRAVIVMPQLTPNVKVERTRGHGAEVILHGAALDEAATFADELARSQGLHLVHPYDDETIITGQGTIALEMLAVHPNIDVLVVPVGGGGLISGIATAAKDLRPSLTIVGVETARVPSMRAALEGRPVACGESTIAEGIAVKHPGRLTLPIVRALVDEILLIDEEQIEEAVLLLLDVEKTVAEGAGAVGLGAVLAHRDRFAGRRVGLIVSGGNLDLLMLSSIIQRGLVRSGRLVHLYVQVRDVPGALGDVATCIGSVGANIIQVNHRRMLASVPLASAEVEFVLQTRGLEHAQRVVETLRQAHYDVRVPATGR